MSKGIDMDLVEIANSGTRKRREESNYYKNPKGNSRQPNRSSHVVENINVRRAAMELFGGLKSKIDNLSTGAKLFTGVLMIECILGVSMVLSSKSDDNLPLDTGNRIETHVSPTIITNDDIPKDQYLVFVSGENDEIQELVNCCQEYSNAFGISNKVVSLDEVGDVVNTLYLNGENVVVYDFNGPSNKEGVTIRVSKNGYTSSEDLLLACTVASLENNGYDANVACGVPNRAGNVFNTNIGKSLQGTDVDEMTFSLPSDDKYDPDTIAKSLILGLALRNKNSDEYKSAQIFYIVEPGETLSEISGYYDSPDNFAFFTHEYGSSNSIDSGIVRVGDVVCTTNFVSDLDCKIDYSAVNGKSVQSK